MANAKHKNNIDEMTRFQSQLNYVEAIDWGEKIIWPQFILPQNGFSNTEKYKLTSNKNT